MTGTILTAEAKLAMYVNLELELKARSDKLRAMCEAQCASLRSRLERRVNRIPAAKRQMPLAEFLAPPAPAPVKTAPTKSAPSKATMTKKANAAALTAQPAAPATATVTRKGRAAPTASKTTTTTAAAKPAPATKAAPKPAVTKAAPKAATTTRGKKRGSDEMSSEDKENTAELDVPKKRVRAPVSKAPATATKTAPATRATRATSRQKTNPAAVLSPKNSNPRQKPAKPATRPR